MYINDKENDVMSGLPTDSEKDKEAQKKAAAAQLKANLKAELKAMEQKKAEAAAAKQKETDKLAATQLAAIDKELEQSQQNGPPTNTPPKPPITTASNAAAANTNAMPISPVSPAPTNNPQENPSEDNTEVTLPLSPTTKGIYEVVLEKLNSEKTLGKIGENKFRSNKDPSHTLTVNKKNDGTTSFTYDPSTSDNSAIDLSFPPMIKAAKELQLTSLHVSGTTDAVVKICEKIMKEGLKVSLSDNAERYLKDNHSEFYEKNHDKFVSVEKKKLQSP